MEREREARRVMKQKNLTPEDAENWEEKMAKIDGQPVTSVTPGHCYRQTPVYTKLNSILFNPLAYYFL